MFALHRSNAADEKTHSFHAHYESEDNAPPPDYRSDYCNMQVNEAAGLMLTAIPFTKCSGDLRNEQSKPRVTNKG